MGWKKKTESSETPCGNSVNDTTHEKTNTSNEDKEDPILAILKKEVNSILKKSYKSGKATGPDKISKKIQKTFAEEITSTGNL